MAELLSDVRVVGLTDCTVASVSPQNWFELYSNNIRVYMPSHDHVHVLHSITKNCEWWTEEESIIMNEITET